MILIYDSILKSICPRTLSNSKTLKMKFIKYKIFVHEYANGCVKYSGIAIFRKNWFSKKKYCLSKDIGSISTGYNDHYFLSYYQPIKYRDVFDSKEECVNGIREAIEKKITSMNAKTIIKTNKCSI